MILRTIAKRSATAAKARQAQASIDAAMSGARPASPAERPPRAPSTLIESAPLKVARPSSRPQPAPSERPSPRAAPVARKPATAAPPVVARRSPSPVPAPAKRSGATRPPPPLSVARTTAKRAPSAPVQSPARALSTSTRAPSSINPQSRVRAPQSAGVRTVDLPLLGSKPGVGRDLGRKAGLILDQSIARALSSSRDVRLAFVLSELLGRPMADRDTVPHDPAWHG